MSSSTVIKAKKPDTLPIFRRESVCRVLGPGVRAVVWVAGCTIRCQGCLVSEAWPDTAGEVVAVEDLARWVLSCEGIEGVTFSGGEPMLQALPLAALVDRVRQERDLGVACYTGYRLETLRSPEQQALLNRVDLLIDGPYVREKHADLRWRGSSNQRLIFLTDRYKPRKDDRGVGLEFSFLPDGRFTFSGVPAWPEYGQRLATP